MKKIGFCFCLMVVLVLSAVMPVLACWAQPIPFEILSEDRSRVFVFVPDEYGTTTAYAAVYEIANNERQLIYTVEDMTSFAYEGNFHFSLDMTHFIRTFPAPGMPVFEVFSYGVQTRVVQRRNFIENYAAEEDFFLSIGPAYIVNWQIENRLSNGDTITISTGEGNTFVFDIRAGEFIYGALPLWMQNSNNDIPSSWADESVERADDLGLLPAPFRSGFERNTTRAEFATIAVALYEHFNEPITGRITFTDTTDTNVEKAAYLGIVSGVGDNRFDPDVALTREQAAVMLVRLWGLIQRNSDIELPAMLDLPYLPGVFTDYEQISTWAFNGVASAYGLRIMNGVGNNLFAPRQQYTREQSIVTIMRMFDLVMDVKPINVNIQFLTQYIRTSWYEGKSGIAVITSENELVRHFASSTDWLGNDFTRKYTAEFFSQGYLVVVALTENSGSNRHRVERIEDSGDIIITRLLPGIGTMDMAGWDIIIELNNDFKPDSFNLIMLNENI
ncbi:MAG: S-layer homology domain-containing protein [Defluviitaleaceae bacterium]|nr:S-layer homology domain-containing protein [Defluviitaleaceae bacterium]